MADYKEILHSHNSRTRIFFGNPHILLAQCYESFRSLYVSHLEVIKNVHRQTNRQTDRQTNIQTTIALRLHRSG